MDRAKSIWESSSGVSWGRGSRGGGAPCSPSILSKRSDWGEGVLDSVLAAGTGGRARFPGGTDLLRFVGILKREVDDELRLSPSSWSRGLKWNMFVNVFRRDLILLRPPGRLSSASVSFMVTSSLCFLRPRPRRKLVRVLQGAVVGLQPGISFTLNPFRKLKYII